MFKSIRFQNFKVLRDTELPLGPFTLIVGPNGSGKSTALLGLEALTGRQGIDFRTCRSAFAITEPDAIRITTTWDDVAPNKFTQRVWGPNQSFFLHKREGHDFQPVQDREIERRLSLLRVFSLDANKLASSYTLRPKVELGSQGEHFPVLLGQLRNQHPERFEALIEEFTRWLPEFDAILFDIPQDGQNSIALRTRIGHHHVAATDLSQGTLLALAMLTLAYLADPPPLVAFEEPDRGLHPRLLQDVRDALYRLAYPEGFGESRAPVQVIATTHNPYFLDLFREHPEEVVIAEKTDAEAKFKRLLDLPYMNEILDGGRLGDIWYSGILGGVPAGS